jgi:hypothetical protein
MREVHNNVFNVSTSLSVEYGTHKFRKGIDNVKHLPPGDGSVVFIFFPLKPVTVVGTESRNTN